MKESSKEEKLHSLKERRVDISCQSFSCSMVRRTRLSNCEVEEDEIGRLLCFSLVSCDEGVNLMRLGEVGKWPSTDTSVTLNGESVVPTGAPVT